MKSEKTSYRDKHDVGLLSQRINSLIKPLDLLVSLGKYLESKPIAEIRAEELPGSKNRVVHKNVLSRSPYILLGGEENGRVAIGSIEKIKHSAAYIFPGEDNFVYKHSNSYRGTIGKVSARQGKQIQDNPVAFNGKLNDVNTTEFSAIDDLWGTHRRHDPFNLLFSIERQLKIRQVSNNLPVCEELTAMMITAAQDADLNPRLQVVTYSAAV